MKKLILIISIIVPMALFAGDPKTFSDEGGGSTFDTTYTTQQLALRLTSAQVTALINVATYPVTINTKHYITSVPNGTDISDAIRAAFSACADGDVIILPRGKFVISGNIDFSGYDISLIGQGADSVTGTMLYRLPTETTVVYPGMFNFLSGAPFNSYYVVSGIYFKSVKGTRFGGSTLAGTFYDDAMNFDRTKNFIVTDNIMQYFNIDGIAVYHKDSITSFNGLIFNNQFLDLYETEFANYGYGVLVAAAWNESHKWITDPELGGNDFVFVENNYFRETRHAMSGGSNAKYVFRYNNILNNWVTTVVDMHGAGAYGNTYSSRAGEIYNNRMTTNYDGYGNAITVNTPYNYYVDAIGIRGGEALIYNNTISNYQRGLLFLLEQPSPGTYPGAYPSLAQIGYKSGLLYGVSDTRYKADHGNGDVFAYNNTFTKSKSGWVKHYIDPNDVDFIKFGRDIDTLHQKPGYIPYTYPHPFRNYYYSFIDSLNKSASQIVTASNISQTGVTLTWIDRVMEDGYYIYKSTDNINFIKTDSTAMNIVTKSMTGLIADTQYWFYIKPYNDAHEGIKSKTITIVTNP